MYSTLSEVSLLWLADGLGEETLDGLRQECRLFRRVAPSSSQSGSSWPLKGKAINDDNLQGIYKLSNTWVIIKTHSENKQNQICSQMDPDLGFGSQGICELFLFIQPSPQMLNRSFCNQLPSLWWKGTNPFTFLVEKGPALYFTNSILPVLQFLNHPA